MRTAVAGGVAAVLTAGLAPLGTTAVAAPPPGTIVGAALTQALGRQSCPEPANSVKKGREVTGKTVSEGTRPDQFTGKVIGTIEDGIAPGLDMVIVQLAGSVITNPDGSVDRGIWAGMSGSPVYAPNGKLIGAVSYGLSWSPSDFAGVTPAKEMYQLRDYTAAGKGSVDVPKALGDRLAQEGASAGAVASGFRRLPMPVTVSGQISANRLKRAAKTTGFPARQLVSGTGAARASGEKIPLRAGGNITATVSYGDATIGGTGTVTAVCGDEVLAFGHPAFFDGRSSMSMHGADALFIQRDDVFGSFKVANPAAPTGTILQDRLAGILGVDGRLPRTTSITSHIRSDLRKRTGTTQVSVPAALDFATFIHLLINIDRVFDHYGKGSGKAAWTMTLRRSDGSQLSYSRHETYSTKYDLAFEMAFGLLRDLWRIQGNPYERVQFVDIDVDARVDEAYEAFRLTGAAVRQHGKWQTLGRRTVLRVHAGDTLHVRGHLEPEGRSGRDARNVRLAVHVPGKAAGEYGELIVAGGDSMGRGKLNATGLEDLLAQMSASPGHASVQAVLGFGRRSRIPQSGDAQRVAIPVRGDRWAPVRVKRGNAG